MFQDLRKFFALCEKTQNFQYGLDESDSFTEEASEEAEDADEERENFDECVTDEECLEPEESCGEENVTENDCLATFASSVTLDGLRVTILSMIEIIDFLLNKPDPFPYVLTGKLNQDSLEVVVNESNN